MDKSRDRGSRSRVISIGQYGFGDEQWHNASGMEDQSWNAEVLANAGVPTKEVIGDDAQREVAGIRHGLEELLKGVFEVGGGSEERDEDLQRRNFRQVLTMASFGEVVNGGEMELDEGYEKDGLDFGKDEA